MSQNTPFPVTSLRIPNPFFEGRNGVYVIHSDPLTLIDTGVATQKARTELQDSLKANGIEIRSIGRIVLTHKHIDHIGNAWWLQEESGAEVFIHEIECESVSHVDPDGSRWLSLVQQRFDFWNVPADLEKSADNTKPFSWEIESALPTPLTEGQLIDLGGADLEVIHTPGHTQGSVCLRLGRVLFSGDHVLPNISPNIGGGDLKHQGLLAAYLRSLQSCQELASEIDLVLPGHGEAFPDLSDRCEKLGAHHRKRLDDVTAILHQHGPMDVYSVATSLFGRITQIHVVLGCAEAQAHLEYLVNDGRAACENELYMTV